MIKLCFLVGAVVVGAIAGMFLVNVINDGHPRSEFVQNGAIWGALAGMIFGAFTLGKSSK